MHNFLRKFLWDFTGRLIPCSPNNNLLFYKPQTAQTCMINGYDFSFSQNYRIDKTMRKSTEQYYFGHKRQEYII